MCFTEAEFKVALRETEARARQFVAEAEAERKSFGDLVSAAVKWLRRLARALPVRAGEPIFRRASR